VLQLVPHWNWPGREGQPVKVMALSNLEKVRLSLNGQQLGEKPVDKYKMVSWDVPYAAGKLEAIGLQNGKEIIRTTVETTGEPVALQLVPDRSTLTGDGSDAQPITVQAVDARGRVAPLAGQLVSFELTGPGEIIGVGNGNPLCHEPEKIAATAAPSSASWQRSLYNGLAQVILQSSRATEGTLRLKATAPGLKPAEISIGISK